MHPQEELLKAIQEAGWEHPSEVQQQCIPKAVAGSDVICQAKAGRGKTGVFVISVLQQLDVVEMEDDKEKVANECRALVMCHTRELAMQIMGEFNRLKTHLKHVRVESFVGGLPEAQDKAKLKASRPLLASLSCSLVPPASRACPPASFRAAAPLGVQKSQPHVAVGTPGRIKALVTGDNPALKVKNLQFFILDECDKMLEPFDMRSQIQEIFLKVTSPFHSALPAHHEAEAVSIVASQSG